jgi:abortive infection bacteriophage resistance protein
VSKPFLSIEGQVQRLRDNGLPLTAAEAATVEQFLQDHNYYRLSGYFRYFQVDPRAARNQFTSDASLTKIQEAYDFNRRLAEQLQSGLSEFEIVFRSQLAYLMAQSTGPDSYLLEATYKLTKTPLPDGREMRTALIENIKSEMQRSGERFIEHYTSKGESVPVWAAVETLSFGTTSKMYGLTQDSQGVFKPLARRFGISHKIAVPIFRAMTVLRNVCAHHGRIWNRTHGVSLEAPRALWSDPDRAIYRDTPWAWAITLGHLVDNVRGDDSYSQGFQDFIASHPSWLVAGLTHPSPK